MIHLQLSFASGESSLTVRRCAVHEALSSLFNVSVWARSADASIDLESLVGKDASLRIEGAPGGDRLYSGIVRYMEIARTGHDGGAAPKPPESAVGLSTYRVDIVPRLWLLTQRQGYRIYQHLAIPDIVDKLLAEWSLAPEWRIDRSKYPQLEYKVQYDESDYAFVSRLLEEAGITLWFDDRGGAETKLVLGDQPHHNPARAGAPLRYTDNPTETLEDEIVAQVYLAHEVRPGAHVIRDHDFRRPAFALLGEAPPVAAEQRYEQFHYRPGAFSIEPGAAGDTPAADDRGIMRHDQGFGEGRAGRALLADRSAQREVTFDASVVDLRPGTVFTIAGHAHPDLDGAPLLVTSFSLQGSPDDAWTMTGRAVFTDAPHVPPAKTPRPEVIGVQTATVVGPAGDEIHCDEFGRVRVQFPWDREGTSDEKSCCWIRPNQGWGGRGYGMLALPRIGQEVLVAFVEGDPDQPVLVSRLYNLAQSVIHPLPDMKTVSNWRSNSSPNADGFNQIAFEDAQGNEEVAAQAQKNLRKLVKNDETITVLHDRGKDVGADEIDTTDHDRTEVTRNDRSESTSRNRTIAVGADRRELIQRDDTEVTQRDRRSLTARDLDVVVKGSRREQLCEGLDDAAPTPTHVDPADGTTALPRMHAGVHLRVNGSRRERIDGTQSLTVGQDQQEEVGGSYALAAGQQIHLTAVHAILGDAPDITLIGAGGFVRIDGSGVTIQGARVEVNVSGSPGKGKGSQPVLPTSAKKAEIGADEG